MYNGVSDTQPWAWFLTFAERKNVQAFFGISKYFSFYDICSEEKIFFLYLQLHNFRTLLNRAEVYVECLSFVNVSTIFPKFKHLSSSLLQAKKDMNSNIIVFKFKPEQIFEHERRINCILPSNLW